MKNEINALMANMAREESYALIEVLSDRGKFGCTEKVRADDGEIYIRKYLPVEIDTSEIEILKQLSHPAFPKVIETYRIPTWEVLIEELLPGESLEDHLQAVGKLTVDQALPLFNRLLDAVEVLHKQPEPIIHRDIKPSNIICGPNGEVHLIDFGTSRIYKEAGEKDTVYLGTPGYAPPEQFGFSQTDVRTDIYALGMTLIHMLTGTPPRRGEKVGDIEVAQGLLSIVKKATELEPSRRQRSVSQLKVELSKVKLERVAKKNHIFPKHRNWPVGVKLALLPVHLFVFAIFVVAFLDGYERAQGFPVDDMVLEQLSNALMLTATFGPIYLFVFNLFNLNNRWKILQKNRLAAQLMISIAYFFLVVILIVIIESLHSLEFREFHLL